MATLRRAQRYILSCEACNPDAEFPFDHVVDQVTGHDPGNTDYVLAQPGSCPRCRTEVREKTLVEWLPGGTDDAAQPLAPLIETSGLRRKKSVK